MVGLLAGGLLVLAGSTCTRETPPLPQPSPVPIPDLSPKPTRTVAVEEIADDIGWVAAASPTSPPIATPTVPPVLSPSPVARRISPDLLLPSLTWGGGGGGGCGALDGRPTIVQLADEGYERTEFDKDTIPLGTRLEFSGCYFPVSEQITTRFVLPDGSVDSGTATTDEYGDWDITWWSLPGEPLGQYALEVVSSAGVHTTPFTVYAPDEPLMTSACRTGEWATAVLTGFAPGEEVLLGRYVDVPERVGGVLAGYDYFTMDGAGTAVVDLPVGHAFLVAIGRDAPILSVYDGETGGKIEMVASARSWLACVP